MSIAAQCRVLDVPRSTFYYRPVDDSPYNRELMHSIDRQYLSTESAG